MIEDASSIAGELPEGRSANAVEALLAERRVDYVTFEDWEALDEFELSRGEAEGRPRVKVCHVDEMLEVIHAGRERRAAAAEPERSVGVAE
jgi:NADPH-dependent glutamate synthase beta subunit-like oxidoreductase